VGLRRLIPVHFQGRLTPAEIRYQRLHPDGRMVKIKGWDFGLQRHKKGR
jgi:hypothetical protein